MVVIRGGLLRIAHVEDVDGPRLRVDDEQPLRAGVVRDDLRRPGTAGIEGADRRQRDARRILVAAVMITVVAAMAVRHTKSTDQDEGDSGRKRATRSTVEHETSGCIRVPHDVGARPGELWLRRDYTAVSLQDDDGAGREGSPPVGRRGHRGSFRPIARAPGLRNRCASLMSVRFELDRP